MSNGRYDSMISQINEIRQNAINEGRFSLFHSKTVIDHFNESMKKGYNLDFYFRIVNSWDKICNLPYEVGISLDGFANEPGMVVGVRRTNLSVEIDENGFPISESLSDIMENGLVNYGHANAYGGGAYMDCPDISLTMTPLKNIEGYINLLGSYHGNNLVILAWFPEELVDDDLHITDESKRNMLYYRNQYNFNVIMPKYLIGAILKHDEKRDEFFTRDEIIQFNQGKHL